MSETVDKKNLLTSKERLIEPGCYGCSIIRPVTIMSV